jgi:type II secretory pathway pseudopilin PulG
MDTVVGFAIIGVLSFVLVTAVTRTDQARQRLDDNATAVRIAQRVLADLRAGKPAPPAPADTQVHVKPATDVIAGGAGVALPPGREWVEVTVNYRGRTATLTGLAPKGGAR